MLEGIPIVGSRLMMHTLASSTLPPPLRSSRLAPPAPSPSPCQIMVRTPLGRLQIITQLLGRHNVNNVLAAVGQASHTRCARGGGGRHHTQGVLREGGLCGWGVWGDGSFVAINEESVINIFWKTFELSSI